MDKPQTTDQPSLEVLLTSPICWKSLKICQFLIESYEYLKEDANSEFREKLKLEALRLNLWNPAKNWKTILGDEHYSILATYRLTSYSLNVNSVLDLHKIIRNKYVHTKEFSDNDKEQLGWFNKTNEGWVLDPNFWVDYWTSRFPRLVPFLWMNLKSVCQSGKLTKFYPVLKPDCQIVEICPESLLGHLERILDHQLNSGLVEHRYTLKTKSPAWTLEFISLPGEIIAELLDKSTSMQLLISAKTVQIKWCGSSAEEKSFKLCSEIGNDAVRIIFANTINDIDEIFIKNQLKESRKVSKLIVFTKENEQQNGLQTSSINAFMEKLQKLGDVEFCETPVTWNELNDATQNKVLENAEFVFQFMNDDAKRVVVLGDVLADIADSSTEILSSLQGNILNELTRGRNPVICGKQKLPTVPSYYAPRPLIRESKTESKIKNTALKSNAFLELPNGMSKEEQIIFISDKPGMGKSMVLSSLAIQAAKNFRTRNNLNVVSSASKFLGKLNESDSLSKEMIYNAFCEFVCESTFETKLLQALLVNSLKVDLFLDGLDEVYADLQHVAMIILKFIKYQMPNIRVWITTRDHMCSESVKQNTSAVYNIKPYTLEDQVHLMVNYWLDSNGKSATKNVKKNLGKFARKCLAGPESRLHKFLSGSPLLTRMLAEVHKENLDKTGLATEISTIYYISDVFDKAIDQKLAAYIGDAKGSLKHTSIVQTLREQLDNAHIYFALKLILGEAVANKFKQQLFVTKENSMRLEATVLEQGIILSFDPTITFIHRTFAEYFVAKFIFKVLTKDYFAIGENDPAFQEILYDHVSQRIPDNQKRNCWCCDFKLHDFWHFLQDICVAVKYSPKSNQFQTLIDMLQITYSKDEFAVKKYYRWAPVFAAIQKENCFDLVSIFLKCQKHIYDLFIASGHNGYFATISYIIENDFWSLDKNPWNKFRQYTTNGYGLLHWIITGLYDLDPDNTNFIEDLIFYILNKDKSQLELRDFNGNTPFMFLLKESVLHSAEFCTMSMLPFFLKRGANPNVTDHCNNNILHVVCYEDKEVIDFYKADSFKDLAKSYFKQWDVLKSFGVKIEKLINVVNDEGKTPLLSAIDFFENDLKAELTVLKIHGADFNAKDKNGNTVVHVAIEKKLKFDFIQELVECGANVGVQNAQGMNAFQWAVSLENLVIAEMLVKRLKVDIDAKDGFGRTVFEYKVSEEMKRILNSLKGRCDKKKMKGKDK